MTTEKKYISEADGVHEDWYLEAKTMTKDGLLPFIERLMTHYSHDMNTVCHAMVASALGALSVANQYPEGQISTEQAQMVMTTFIRKWLNLDGPARLQLWNSALLKSNRDQFLGIPESIRKHLEELAGEYLKQDLVGVDAEQIEYMKEIAAGTSPYGLTILKDEA